MDHIFFKTFKSFQKMKPDFDVRRCCCMAAAAAGKSAWMLKEGERTRWKGRHYFARLFYPDHGILFCGFILPDLFINEFFSPTFFIGLLFMPWISPEYMQCWLFSPTIFLPNFGVKKSANFSFPPIFYSRPQRRKIYVCRQAHVSS